MSFSKILALAFESELAGIPYVYGKGITSLNFFADESHANSHRAAGLTAVKQEKLVHIGSYRRRILHGGAKI